MFPCVNSMGSRSDFPDFPGKSGLPEGDLQILMEEPSQPLRERVVDKP